MAWSASKPFSAFLTDALNRTNAFDLNADTFNNALFDNTITPSQTVASASTAYGAGVWASGGVSSGSSWPAAGRPLASVTSAFSSATYTFDAADTVSADAAATITNAYGCLIYDDTLASVVIDQGVCYLYLGGANSVVAGTFTVVYHASGLLTGAL